MSEKRLVDSTHNAQGKKLYEHKCERCSERFKSTNTVQKYCSHLCYSESKKRPVENRFWEKVNKNGQIPKHKPELGPCWIWDGATNAKGYGTFFYGPEDSTLVHRLSYKWFHGQFDESLDVCHHCDNPACCNPNHLFTGTNLDNMRDCALKGRTARGEMLPQSKLTEKQVIKIRNLRLEGESIYDITKRFPVTHGAISMICSGKRWKHLLKLDG